MGMLLIRMPMRMYVLMAGVGCPCRSNELSVFDTLHADQAVGKLAYATVWSAQDQGLQALVLIQVYVQCRCYEVEGLVLRFGQFAAEIGDVVIVDQRNGRNGLSRFVCQDLLGQRPASQVAQRF